MFNYPLTNGGLTVLKPTKSPRTAKEPESIFLSRGISSIIGPPLAGVVYELTSSYDISFFLAGSFLMVAALFSISADIVRQCGSSKDQEDFEDNCGDLE